MLARHPQQQAALKVNLPKKHRLKTLFLAALTLFPIDRAQGDEPLCLQKVEKFCDELYSPKILGNMDLGFTDGKKIEIRLGRTPNNIDYATYFYIRAKLESRKALPRDLLAILNARRYFETLESFLKEKSYEKMTFAERTRNLRLTNSLGLIWAEAVEEVVLRRTEKLHPGYFRMMADRTPPKWKQDESRTRDELNASINRTLWENSSHWKKVREEFEDVRKEFLEEAKDLPQWQEKIRAVKLLPPGSDPKYASSTCASVEKNAMYEPQHNRLTVCAGLFTTIDSTLIISHEFAHALGLSRAIYLTMDSSTLGKRFRELKSRSCSANPVSCDEWEKWKNDFKKDLGDLKGMKIEQEELRACLQGKKITQTPEQEYLRRVAREKTIDEIEAAAASNSFLSMIKDKVKVFDGHSYANPAFLNPCGLWYWDYDQDSLSAWYTLKVFFANEYRCSKTASLEGRLKESIETAKSMQTDLTERRLLVPGKFSSERRLKADSYAEDSEEKFADLLGEKVFSRVLKRMSSQQDRWNLYLANISLHCDPPSWKKEYPSEAQVEKQYYFDPHSEGKQRRIELTTQAIREALGCKKDFELNECPIGH